MPYAIAVMRALVKEYGVAVDCICWDHNKRTPFVPVDEEGITFHKRSEFDETAIMKFIAARKPGIMYVTGRMDKLYMKAAVRFLPTCAIVTGCDNQWNNTPKQMLAAMLSPWLYKKYFEYFWVPGKRQHEFAEKMGYPERKIIPHLLTADTAVFGGVRDKNLPVKKAKYPHTMVYAGRFAKEKGVDILMEAFTAAIQETGSDWELLLVGAGDMPVATAPFIKVSPFMQGGELAASSKDWGVFCLPSTYEPWGVVIHEFAMAGMPIICSDAVGAADDLVVNNSSGFIFKSGDVGGLKKAIVAAMSKSDTELLAMGERGYELSKVQSPAIAARSLMSIVEQK